ncbi:PFL_4669 family integrating conjugative element protein [Ideonella sp. YS5]|uniref:PFL_4669 family integrating conjugative element protein n=1 Tax=Ideonella sp. YS5 TaxID=3453714 RepID=UPI003EEBB29E
MSISDALKASKKAPRKPKLPPPFPVSKTSPFPDGYDIEAERIALKDMVEADDLDMADPRFSRYAELERRETLLRQMKSEHSAMDGAEKEVTYREAIKVKNDLGKLTDEADDSMTIHTREASRLFIGRAKLPGESGYGQSGGKKVGASLRAIWYLSGNDNPYADFALIEAHGSIESSIATIEERITAMEARLEKIQRRGLTFSVVRADPPVSVELGFRSPYGYAVVRLISTFDYFVRLIKTLVRKDLLSDKEGYQDIFTITRSCRRIFERVVWFQRYLMKEELRQLSRVDWLPTADEQAKKRLRAAVALFGELPRDVFNGDLAPRHSRRQLDVSAEELRLLNEVPLAGDEAQLATATDGLQ